MSLFFHRHGNTRQVLIPLQWALPRFRKEEKTGKGYRSVQHLGAGRRLNPGVAKALVVDVVASVLRA